MTNEILSVFMNLMMAGLLLATIIYCLKLNSRIRVLQDSKSELARIIREFDESTKRATQSINEIHAATTRISENIQHKIDKANYLADDLEMMIERGNKLAGKVDAAALRPVRAEPPSTASTAPKRSLADIMPGRTPDVAATTTAPADAAATRRPLRMRSRAEQDIMNLMGAKNNDESGR
jgi:hypothetical protein